ncbi:MAG: DUF3810 family protein [Vicinamibacterales bacterium]|nr:DUF3810 family protein [Vicinamibacterales bacterium]
MARTAETGRAATRLVSTLMGVAVVGAACALAAWPTDPGVVELSYSTTVYPVVQRLVTLLSNATPFSWLDALVGAASLWVLWRAWRIGRAPRGQRWAAVGTLLWHGLVVSAIGYLLFAGMWGLNYRRLPLERRVAYERDRVTAEAVSAFAGRAVASVNALSTLSRSGDHAAAGVAAVAEQLGPAFDAVVRDLRLPAVERARPKTPVLSVWFNAMGVSGMTNPFGLETLVASNLLDHERPMVVAHEWAHLAGIGPESEATFVAFVVCLRSGPGARYSAWLDVTLRTLRILPDAERAALAAQLEPAVRADIQAMADRNERDQLRWLSLTAWNVYDRYLKANRVPAGVRSYDEVVALLVGTQFTDEGGLAKGPGT